MDQIFNNKKAMLYSFIASGLFSIYTGLRFYSLNGARRITGTEAKHMIRTGRIQTIIDVRTNVEYSIGHYPQSINLPLQSLTKKQLTGIMKNTQILVYCNTGQRARRASEFLHKNGYENVYYISESYKTLL